MSGRNCAYGLYFQYLVSLGFLLDLLDNPDRCRLRVDPSSDSDDDLNPDLQIIDLDVFRDDGNRIVAAQVKGAVDPETASPVSAPDLADWLRRLLATGPSESYQVVTNRRLTEPAQRIAAALETQELSMLESAWPGLFIADFQDPTGLPLILKCRVIQERQTCEDLLHLLRARIKELRVRARTGTGNESAGLLTIYLVGQLLYHGSGDHPDEITADQALRWLQISPTDLAQSIGHYDWGVRIGVPFPGNTIRTSKLPELAHLLQRSQAVPRTTQSVVVQGLSGQGKSTLASQFACDYADHYDFMWWVDCESESSIRHSFNRLTSAVPVLDWGSDDPSLHDIPTALSKFPGRWLLVADNVYDRKIVTPWLPTSGSGDVIITTVDRTLWPHEHRIDLDGFTSEESHQFLCDQLPTLQTHGESLRELAEDLEHWPLALAMAAAYLTNAQRDLRETPRGYLEKLRSTIIRTPTAVDDRKYPRTLAAAISLVLGQVRRRAAAHPFVEGHDVGRLAIHGLVAAAYCAESDIPSEILWPDVLDDGDPESAPAAIVLDAVITLLRSGSLARRVQLMHDLAETFLIRDRITLNRITQDVIRSEVEAENSSNTVAQFVIELCGHTNEYLGPAIDQQQFKTIAALLNHAEHIILHGNRLQTLHPELTALHGNLALAFEKHGRYVEAISLLEDEIAMIDRLTNGVPCSALLKTLTQLTNCVIRAGRPFEEILARIAQTVNATEQFQPKSQRQLLLVYTQWANLRTLLDGLRQHESDPLVIALRARVYLGANRLPKRSGDAATDRAIDCIGEAVELSTILRRKGREREVLDRARIAFSTCPYHHIKIQLLGLQIEAYAYLRNTSSVMNGMRELEVFAQPKNIHVDVYVNVLQNVGLAIWPQLDVSDEYANILRLTLQMSEERMSYAPPNPNLEWFHHVLSSVYLTHIGDSAAARPHVAAANSRRPTDESVGSFASWEAMLARASSLL